jgi:hypothetical protein
MFKTKCLLSGTSHGISAETESLLDFYFEDHTRVRNLLVFRQIIPKQVLLRDKIVSVGPLGHAPVSVVGTKLSNEVETKPMLPEIKSFFLWPDHPEPHRLETKSRPLLG